MRVSAVVLACVLLATSMPASGAAPTSSPDAVLALCRLWNAVRFTHPALEGETDARWDDAFLATEPNVERDPASLRGGAAALLATLDDPMTTLEPPAHDAAPALPTVSDRDGIRYVRVAGATDGAQLAAFVHALVEAFALPAGVRGVIVDLTAQEPPSPDQMATMQDAWELANIASHVIDAPILSAVTSQRYFLGLPGEAGIDPNGYREGRETLAPERTIAPANGARAVPVAFVVGRSTVVPLSAATLVRAGRAAIFTVDGSPGLLPGSPREVDAGAGLSATLRTVALTAPVVVRDGGRDAAAAWIVNPNAAPAPPARNAQLAIAQRYAAPALPDQPHRVLAACRAWGAIAYFFPYASLMHDDWDAAFRTALPELHDANTLLAYHLAIERMYAHVHDSHGIVWGAALRGPYGAAPAFVARYVEGRPTIVRVDPVAAKRDGFTVGDVVEAVDGEPIAAVVSKLRPYVDASTEQSLRETLMTAYAQPAVFSGPPNSIVRLRLRGADGRARDVRTMRVAPLDALSVRTRPVVDLLPGNVGYADLARLTPAGVVPMLARFASTRALVLDLRGYPHETASVLGQHFLATPARMALIRTPIVREPRDVVGPERDERYLGAWREFAQVLQPEPPRYGKPVVVVIDARAMSQSEHTAMFLRESAHARFVGEPTAGANGDVTFFLLPGGIAAFFSGQAIMHANGAQLQRIGIIPDVPAHQTLSGVRAGDDELLSAALREALRLGHADASTTRVALARERDLERADAAAQRQFRPSVTGGGASGDASRSLGLTTDKDERHE